MMTGIIPIIVSIHKKFHPLRLVSWSLLTPAPIEGSITANTTKNHFPSPPPLYLIINPSCATYLLDT
jgi:hypothetical protein